MSLRTLTAIAWTVVIVGICLFPGSWLGSGGEDDGPSLLDRIFMPIFGSLPYDKFIHFSMFFGFGWLWRWARVPVRQTLVAGAVLAVLTELGQSIPGLERTTDLDDLIANLLGLVMAVALFRLWPSRTTEPNPKPEPPPMPSS